MSLFNNFVNKASIKLDRIQNPQEQINKKKFKDLSNNQIKVSGPMDEKTNEKKIEDNYIDDDYNFENKVYNDSENEINLLPAQRPESFHFFILENQYQDLERSIRGVKDVWDKDLDKWVIKKKQAHCFTDEESEEIVRTAQSHLSSDIKLAIINREEYPILLNGIYEQIWVTFRQITEYRFGRFGSETNQLKMKQQAVNIFNMLMMRIKANYSRAIEGSENKATHDSVKGQESLNQTGKIENSRSYT